MLRYDYRFLIVLILLISTASLSFAQNLATTSTGTGVLIDYPENWEIEDTDFESIVAFSSGSMSVGVSIIPLANVRDDPAELLESLADDIARDDNGDFEESEEYIILEQYNAAWTSRARLDDRLIEYLAAAEVGEFSVYLRGTFRIGAQDFFIPIYDTIIASVRDANDEIILTSGSTAQRPITDGMIGSVLSPLNMGALNTNFITDDEQYQFEYPDTWDIRTEADSSITIIERNSSTASMYGHLHILPVSDDTDNAALVAAQFEDTVDVVPFMLNDLPASQVIIEDEANNVRRIVMAVIRGNIQTLLDVTHSLSTSDSTDAVLRAMLYTVRPNGETFTLNVTGHAMRTGLLSAEVYGEARVLSNEIIVDGLVLGSTYVTGNGRFTFNYPSEWFEEIIDGLIVVSNDDDIILFDPGRNDIQVAFNFLDDPEDFLEDDFSPSAVLNYVIENDDFQTSWSDITIFDSLDRQGAYADFDVFDSDLVLRVYFVKLDDLDSVYVRVDMVVDEDDLEEYELIVLAIIDTVRFQD